MGLIAMTKKPRCRLAVTAAILAVTSLTVAPNTAYAQHRGGHYAGIDVSAGPHADGHDRLPQRDDHDQTVALGEVTRHQLPAV